MTRMFFVLAAVMVFVLLLLAGCERDHPDFSGIAGDSRNNTPLAVLTVFKSPTCGCCEGWIEHLDSDDFEVSVRHPVSLDPVKARFNLAPEIQSCHTAVTDDGYVFEGHVPWKFMKRFLAEKPQGAIGLAVPGMPLGSPGMEVGGRFTPYQILLVQEDGSTSIYASVSQWEDQYE